MILCLELGNSQLYGGLYKDGQIVLRCRKSVTNGISSDELGLFLTSVIRENGYNKDDITKIVYCSVVPELNHSLHNSCRNYFHISPMTLQPGIKTGLKIKYANPKELGADRIATALGACSHYPGENLIIVSLSTTTTFDAITGDKEYLGGAIFTGMKIAMQSLEEKTAKLPSVEIVQPLTACGRSTTENIQAGLYYGTLGAIKEITSAITTEKFGTSRPRIIATGGFSSLYKHSSLFDEIVPDLVLQGLYTVQELNP